MKEVKGKIKNRFGEEILFDRLTKSLINKNIVDAKFITIYCLGVTFHFSRINDKLILDIENANNSLLLNNSLTTKSEMVDEVYDFFMEEAK